ncbi:MAG: acetyltransferase [Prevotellaceae bacterium]|jgi:RimJ/RimL family protein N-acetyltransferase|nr:acetyltransferase [Prevotellaceae bacterium]
MNDSLLTLKPVTDADVELVEKWLYEEHVLKWYHDTDEWLKEIKERNGAFGFLHHFIVNQVDKPIGFCQYYDCFDAQEEWYSVESRGKIFSIDYLIGEKDFLRKGFGKQIIKLLIDEISKEHQHFEIVVQPETENTASNKTLLASGFIYDETKQYYISRI